MILLRCINYPGYIGLENAEDGYTPKVAAQNFLNYITEVYDHYRKPLWIAEFAVAAWDSNEYWHPYDGNQNEHNEAVQEFMDYVINGFDDIQGLDELPFVKDMRGLVLMPHSFKQVQVHFFIIQQIQII